MLRTSTNKSLFPVVFGLLFLVSCSPAVAQTGIQTARLLAANESTHPRTASLNLISPAATAPTLEQASQIERHAFDETNRARLKNGLTPFVWDAVLCRMARAHSEDMGRHNFFSHVNPDGQRLKDRAQAAGILHFTLIGENIAYNLGYDDPGTFAVERWMLSPKHRANILDEHFNAMAVGTFVAPDGSVYLTQTFIQR
ncbi:MAG TPA: CAP domain-containing protein [Pyrinomonadaceae bacterium]|nr:CAP domain-containing protein [Pyrinomonadaceae bacterium]